MKYNYGVALVKVAACFGVVYLHFGPSVHLWAAVSAPAFMLIAVFLNAKKIGSRGVLSRIKRLYIPFGAWGLIYFLFYSIAEKRFDVNVLLKQLLLGVPACPPLYFIMLLMVSTVILWALQRVVSGSLVEAAVLGLAVACLALQYSGLNACAFGKLPLHEGASLGRFAELFPAAAAGYLLAVCVRRRWLVALLSMMFFGATAYFGMELGAPGFSYQGLRLLALATGLSSAFIWLGDIVKVTVENRYMLLVKDAAGQTAGIYYVHLLVGKILELFVGRHRGAIEAFVVFALSAAVVWAIKRQRRIVWLVS